MSNMPKAAFSNASSTVAPAATIPMSAVCGRTR